MSDPIQTICCHSPGLTMEGVTFNHCHNALGGFYWKATAKIGSIFGSEVDGQCEGIGRTKDEALARLRKEGVNT